jgi:hypothetical protein
VWIDVVVTTPEGPLQYQAQHSYRVEGTAVTISDGFLTGSIGGVVAGTATSVPLNGSTGFLIAGTLVRRTIEAVGRPGATGAAGAAGADGATGAVGAAGPNGTAGTNGTNGTNGAQGPPGNAGAQGLQGIPGNAGPQGPVGPPGPGGILLTGGSGQDIGYQTFEYSGPGVGELSMNYALVEVPVPAGALSNLRARTSVAMTGTSHVDIGVFVNGGFIGLACQINAGAHACSMSGAGSPVLAGDRVSLRFHRIGDATATRVTYSLQLAPSP